DIASAPDRIRLIVRARPVDEIASIAHEGTPADAQAGKWMELGAGVDGPRTLHLEGGAPLVHRVAVKTFCPGRRPMRFTDGAAKPQRGCHPPARGKRWGNDEVTPGKAVSAKAETRGRRVVPARGELQGESGGELIVITERL